MDAFRKIIPFVLVSTLALAVGYVLAQQTGTSPHVTALTEGWKTYKDSANGFTVKFPLAAEQVPLDGQVSTDPEKGQVSLPDAVGGKGRWLEISTLQAKDTNLTNTRCLKLEGPQFLTTDRFFDGRRYCVSVATEGAAGSIYTTTAYTTRVGEQYVILKFTSRHATDVHVYGDCEEDWDLNKTICQNYAFDPIRDFQLFDDIAATLSEK